MKIKKNFLKKLDLACGHDELRPVLSHLIFEDDSVVCTNAHILVKQHLSLHGFEEEEIKQMNGKAIHYDTFKEILRYDNVNVINGQFVCEKGRAKAKFDLTILDKYVDYKQVLPNGGLVSVDEIGFDLRYMEIARKVTLGFDGGVTAKFYGRNKSIILTGKGLNIDEELILIMPLMIR